MNVMMIVMMRAKVNMIGEDLIGKWIAIGSVSDCFCGLVCDRVG